MRGLIKRAFGGWKRTRVPENVWEIWRESAPTQVDGRTAKERLAMMPTDHILTMVQDHFRDQGSCYLFLTYLREDLNNNRGEVSLLES